jgi:hypothetical protein
VKHTRSALALSSVALTLAVLITGMPHACADPCDETRGVHVTSSGPGLDQALSPRVATESGSGGGYVPAPGRQPLVHMHHRTGGPFGVRTPTGHDVHSAGVDAEPPRSVAETLAAVAIGCGVQALASLAFFAIKGGGCRGDADGEDADVVGSERFDRSERSP